jgi:DNA-binding winged helix-turn-helix (wHTH) protein
MTTSIRPVRYRFGRFELQPKERRLMSGSERVPLAPRAFDVLVALVERSCWNASGRG